MAYLRSVSDRLVVVRAIVAGQVPAGSKLDVWRTEPPIASAPVWLTPDEITAVVEAQGLGSGITFEEARGGARRTSSRPQLSERKSCPAFLLS